MPENPSNCQSTEKKQEPPYGRVFVKIPCRLTGQLVWDTDRERIRQKLVQFMVDEKGYSISDFVPDREIFIEIGGQKAVATVDLTVCIKDRSLMILRGGPGSVITRESGTIAAARLLEPEYIVPWAVQANLFDASILDVRKKKAVAHGWDAIPARSALIEMTRAWPPPRLPEERIPVEKQILFSYDTHGCMTRLYKNSKGVLYTI